MFSNHKLYYIYFLLSSTLLFPSGTITGKINDTNSKEPLIGVNVILLETTKKVEMFGDLMKERTITVQVATNYGASTDMDGEYIIKNVPLGDYTLKAMYIGYENEEIPISIEEDKKYIFNINLNEGEIILDETSVTAFIERQEKKMEAPATIQTVDSKQIEQASTTNLGSYLQGLKGVDFTASGINNYSLSIRGFNSSFSTRLLLLTDGRPANVPSLRVVNFSTVPSTADDIDKIEVILGPATALYGANAHSGVINIVSKPPSSSEGFTASYSGTLDDRNLKKFNGRFAKKINNRLSFKISGSHLSAIEWPYISELEYKAHRNPWVGFPGRQIDGKDNNVSVTSHTGGLSPATEQKLRWVQTIDHGIQINKGNVYLGLNGWNNEDADAADGLYYLMLGDGEPNHGDLDGDGYAGEDWFNGHDDDGDGLIDEDYWFADGIDNAEPFTDSNNNGVFDFIDINQDSIHQGPEPFFDTNGNNQWDQGEWYQDLQGSGYTTGQYDVGEEALEPWEDWDLDGAYDNYNNVIDELIDREEDEWVDGVDNNGNGMIDEGSERYTNNQIPSQWANAIDDQNVLIRYGRVNRYYVDGSLNPWYIQDGETDLRGSARYNDEKFTMEFDVYEWDFGEDGIAGDYHYDFHGDDSLDVGEPGVYGFGGVVFQDFGLDGFKYYDINEDGAGHYAVYQNSQGDFIYINDLDGNLIWIDGPDEGEGDGIWQAGDTWFDGDGDWQVDDDEAGWIFNNNFTYLQHIVGVDDGGMEGVVDDCYPGYWGAGFSGDVGWNFLSYGTSLENTEMELDDSGSVLNCYGICPGESSEYYNPDCETDLSLYISYEINDDVDAHRYIQNQEFIYNQIEVSQNIFYDVWPPPDFVVGENDITLDCGQDGHCWDYSASNQGTPQHARDIWGTYLYETNENGDQVPMLIEGPDYGEGDGFRILDNGDYDGEYDTSDENWATSPESFVDANDNGIYDQGEAYTDEDGNGYYTQGDWHPNLDKVYDTNGDGKNDFPDYEVINNKLELRVDYDPNQDFNLSFQSGYAYTKTQQVTGVGRYLADGWESNYYQLRGRYKNWFMQGYLNTNDAGQTRGYNRGDMILDQSKNYGVQIQNSFSIPKYATEVIWGLDYMKTLPYTNGSVLNDGPNGFDDDEDSQSYVWDLIDDDGDGLSYGDEVEKIYGIDEDDEFTTNILSNELGFYFQSKTKVEKYLGLLSGKWEFIASARLDYHDQLKEEGILFGPKVGLIYNPMTEGVVNEFTTFRLGYGKAFNTPTITSLFTNLIFGRWGENFTMILRGNRDGTPYARADNFNQLGEWGFPVNLSDPFFHEIDDNGNFTGNTIKLGSSGLNDCTFDPNNPCDPYIDRVQGAPLFFNTGDGDYPGDYIPLDTLNHIIFIPSAYDDGVNYTPLESVNLSDVDPLRSESTRTLELGFSSFIPKINGQISAEIYFTRFNDFFSPATFITPLVKDRYTDEVVGLISSSLNGTYAPYGTAWDGMDNDNDWSGFGYYVSQDDIECTNGLTYPCGLNQANGTYYLDYEHLEEIVGDSPLQDWSVLFGWDDDKDGDGNPQDPGEWGYIDVLCDDEGQSCDLPNGGFIYTIIQPDQIWDNVVAGEVENSPLSYLGAFDNINGRWIDVGIDEYSTLIGGYYEAEIIDEDTGKLGFPDKLPIIILSSLNYGEVYHSGIDVGYTHFFSERFTVDLNFTFFNSTDYYNELTKRFDPINSPKFKFNIAGSYNTKKLGTFLFKLRHVDKFDWADGTWAGTIGPYNILDLHYNYKISDNLKFGFTAMNLLDDRHRELIGGAKMGRQVILRVTTQF